MADRFFSEPAVLAGGTAWEEVSCRLELLDM